MRKILVFVLLLSFLCVSNAFAESTFSLPVPVPQTLITASQPTSPLLGIWVGEQISIFDQVMAVSEFDTNVYVMIVAKDYVKYVVGSAEPMVFTPQFAEDSITLVDANGASLVLRYENDLLCMDADAGGYPMTFLFRKIL